MGKEHTYPFTETTEVKKESKEQYRKNKIGTKMRAFRKQKHPGTYRVTAVMCTDYLYGF